MPANAASSATMSAAVWPAWVPEPTPRLTSGLGQPEVAEEHVGHRRVVVLAGVDEPLVHAPRAEGRDDGRGLHEVRPRADHVYDGVAHVAEYACPPGRARPPVG